MNGFIPLEREVLQYSFYKDINAKTLYIHLRCICTYSCYNYCGVSLLPFQVLTSYRKLAFETGLSVKQVRTAIDRLVEAGAIEVKPRGKGRYGGTIIQLLSLGKFNVGVNRITSLEAEFNGLVEIDFGKLGNSDLIKLENLYVLTKDKLCARLNNITQPTYRRWIVYQLQVLEDRHCDLLQFITKKRAH